LQITAHIMSSRKHQVHCSYHKYFWSHHLPSHHSTSCHIGHANHKGKTLLSSDTISS
jgi:hypothetical protein